jgi:hypothetical protein
MGKRLYFGGCSFLQSPNIFIDSKLNDYFGRDSEVINNAFGGSNNDQIFRKAFFSIQKNDFDFVLIGWTQSWRIDKVLDIFDKDDGYEDRLREEASSDILKTSYFYTGIIGNDKNYSKFSHHEPEGTDNVIMYTIILHQLLKSKNIPHLFITMGELNYATLSGRSEWLKIIDEKNYFGKGKLIDRMGMCLTDLYHDKHIDIFGKDFDESTYHLPNSIIRDNSCHLSENGGRILAKEILEHIIDNEIVSK